MHREEFFQILKTASYPDIGMTMKQRNDTDN